MIKRQKNLLIFLLILFIVLMTIALIITIAIKSKDIFPVFLVIYDISLLLILNVRSGSNNRKKFHDKFNKAKQNEKEEVIYKEGQKILWITFAIMVIFTITLCAIIYSIR